MFTVLHVERNTFYIEMVKNLVADLDMRYRSAESPEDAFHILESSEIGLIITGLEFEECTGEEFIVKLNNSSFDNIPVIVLSATEEEGRKEQVYRLGVLDFISKSILSEKLRGYIRSFQAADFALEKLRQIRIAVLDDNEFELSKIKRIFELNRVLNVDYYLEPRTLLNTQNDYDLYLIDYIMPKISGEQVLAQLRARYEYALMIAISSIDNTSVVSGILNSGADDYITKPFDETVFMARLRANVRTYMLVEQLKQKNKELEAMVKIDGLTGLFNHKAVIQSLEYEIAQCQRNFRHLSIMMFDIDNFKEVNDRYGHQFGDEVLVEVSRICKNCVRKGDILGRYGGEEFLLILPETQIQGAYMIAEKLRIAISSTKFDEKGASIRISGGVAEMKNDTSGGLIKKADEMLYKAKTSGKDMICRS